MAAPSRKLAVCWTFHPIRWPADTVTVFKRLKPSWKELIMKEMNENQLLAWRPRRPSAGLRRRFRQLVGNDEVPTARWLWSCVAPTMACALLTLMAFNSENAGLGSKLPMTLILSNQE